jgi:hypothetical protein
MPKDPIGMLGRLNTASLMIITPEYMQLKGLRVRYATNIDSDGPTVLFFGPLPQIILCYDATWFALSADANLVALDLLGFGQIAQAGSVSCQRAVSRTGNQWIV